MHPELLEEALGLAGDVVDAVAPGNPYLGVMPPYTPLHHLLMAAVGRPVVCTSGNLSDEPIAIDEAEALVRLKVELQERRERLRQESPPPPPAAGPRPQWRSAVPSPPAAPRPA